MIQCVNEGHKFLLIKYENLKSETSDFIVQAANYRIRRKRSDILADIQSNIESVQFPEINKNISFDKLNERIFSVKQGYPLEFKDKDMDEIKQKAFSA